jgi:HAT1-interacting factor 1
LSVTVEEAVERAKRAFALKKYEEAVDHYATALELELVPFHPLYWPFNGR